ncbi:MAG TPA: DUF3352 domain-containing protein [Pyrinomonadaceae bacterium]|nr:DUF3352 domain-containing protein [Pyrinomonadaceae bacterium]
MKYHKSNKRLFVSLCCALTLLVSPALAQQRRSTPPRKPAIRQAPEPVPTFDNLFAADSYRIYGEIRQVGALIRSPAVKDLLDPMIKLGGPPKEFRTAVKWLNAHAEVLTGSRMLVAAWPARPKLPTVLIAIEFASVEEAKKFEPELRGFIPMLLPTPTPTPAEVPDEAKPKTVDPSVAPKQDEPALPPYQMKQAGSLILLSDQPFALRDLVPPGSKAMAEDQNFTMARNRFASESVFLYVDIKSIEKEERDQSLRAQEEARRRIEAEAANPPKEEESVVATAPEEQPELAPVEEPPPPVPDPSGPPPGDRTDAQTSTGATLQAGQADPLNFAFGSLWSLLFGGQPKWPEAVGAALAFEGDGYVLRTLIINDEQTKDNAVPFVPQFVTGPPLVIASSGIFPADVELMVAVSLDYNQIHQGMLKSFVDAEEASRKFNVSRPGGATPTAADHPPESPFAILEKRLGLKIKDDLIPLLGNEIALAMPAKAADVTTSKGSTAEPKGSEKTAQEKPVTPEPGPIIAVAVKDKEGVKRLIPKLIEALGAKGANMFAQTEKRGDTEITSYAGMFSYAFVGDFLVLSTDPTAARHVADSFLEHQTLSSNSSFRNSSRWQPRQVQGQVYVGPGLIERYYPMNGNPAAPVNEKMREFLTQMNPVIEPVTYALSNEGMGPFHELHVPKSLLVLLTAGLASDVQATPLTTNESIAKSLLQTVASAEATFQSTKGAGRYATLDELISEGLVSKDLLEKYGYKIEVSVSTNRFEAVAIPREYGQTGRLSYFVDQSGLLRGGDHGGGAATIADKPID